MHAALLFFALTGGMPGYADLPSGHTTAPPETVAPPAAIPAAEKVPGFFVATPSFGRRVKTPMGKMAKGSAPPSYVVVVGTAERKQKVESGDFSGSRTDQETGACFTQARFHGGPPHARPPEAEGDDQGGAGETVTEIADWNEGFSGAATVNVKTEHNPNAGVVAVHRERLVTDAAGTRIEIDDAWVDPATKGVRKLASTTLPLKLVGSSRGLEVWAAREERPDGTKLVQFVVIPPRGLPDGPEALATTHGDGRNMSSNSCSHLRVAMSAADGAADSAILKTSLRLPDVDRGKEERPRERKEGEEEEEKRARIREAAVHLGVSKATRDKEPIVSVTFGWSGRETSQVVRNDD